MGVEARRPVRERMTRRMVLEWRRWYDALAADGYATAGTRLEAINYMGGNFWAARCDYCRTLPSEGYGEPWILWPHFDRMHSQPRHLGIEPWPEFEEAAVYNLCVKFGLQHRTQLMENLLYLSRHSLAESNEGLRAPG
jgi:hypothetical protein